MTKNGPGLEFDNKLRKRFCTKYTFVIFSVHQKEDLKNNKNVLSSTGSFMHRQSSATPVPNPKSQIQENDNGCILIVKMIATFVTL